MKDKPEKYLLTIRLGSGGIGEVLSALEYARGRTVAGVHAGLVHSDVTPGNVLVSSVGEVKLTDFGVARFIKLAEATLSRAIGTPRYMSPEQMTGRHQTIERTHTSDWASRVPLTEPDESPIEATMRLPPLAHEPPLAHDPRPAILPTATERPRLVS